MSKDTVLVVKFIIQYHWKSIYEKGYSVGCYIII